MKLRDRSAILTGGASGIGRAMARAFAREGAAVLLVDRDERGGAAVAREIVEGGGKALFEAADVTRADDCARAVRRAVTELGGPDILVNNAGIIRRATVVDLPVEEWDRVMDVNLKAIFLMGREAIPVMARRGGGVIVNTASGWGLVGGPRAVAYCASKGGVILLTRSMAIDHGRQNIRVNCICPGDTDTPLLAEEGRQLGAPADLFMREAAERPLGRVGRPEEIAEAALFLASDDSSFMTGSALVVDGGGTAG